MALLTLACAAMLALLPSGQMAGVASTRASKPGSVLVILVADPLARQNACSCVKGYAQRDYLTMGRYLERRLARLVTVKFGSSLALSVRELKRNPDMIVGKQSVIEAYCAESGTRYERIAMLTGEDGLTTQQGLFVVRSDDNARAIPDLKGRKILFGPKDEEEKCSAALSALTAAGLEAPSKPESRANCNITALAVVEREAGAGVISGYALPLLSGCGTIKKGALKVVGKTAPVPFVAVYASSALPPRLRHSLASALFRAKSDSALLRRMESRDGFVAPRSAAPQSRLYSGRRSQGNKPPAPRGEQSGQACLADSGAIHLARGQPSPRPSATPLPTQGQGTRAGTDSVSIEGNRLQAGPPSPGVGRGDGGEGHGGQSQSSSCALLGVGGQAAGPSSPPITGGTIGRSAADRSAKRTGGPPNPPITGGTIGHSGVDLSDGSVPSDRSVGSDSAATSTRSPRYRGAGGATKPHPSPFWTDWRGGPARDGISSAVPSEIPANPRIIWRRAMESLGLGGVSATDRLVIVSDKSRDGRLDIWRCLDAGTGAPMWNLSYPAPGKMDYGSAPRASPVIVGETAYLLGALGHLYAAEVRTGRALWHCNLPQKFGGKVPQWGFAATPLVVDNKVVVTTGSPLASLAALDCRTGAVVWAAPGNPPGYGNFIVATLGGRRQLVGHDAATLGGWDPATGRRLWTLTPPERHDFNVPTPVAIGGKLLVATENNGTRLYSFDSGGHIVPLPVAIDRDLRPQTPSPVVVDGMVWCGSDSGLYCLDLGAGLSKVWSSEERPFTEHVSLIGGNGHVLVATKDGHVVLFPARPPAGYIPNSVNVLPDRPPDSDVAFWSHPALVGSRLYLRSNSELICLSLAL